MKENDKTFIDQVADFYFTTVDEAHPQGNMSAVADQFGITRAKVNKILITAGVIDVNNGGRATAARDFSPPRTGKVPILAAAEPSL